MKAITYRSYGTPDVLQLAEIDQPSLGDDQVLVAVEAASVNPVDWHAVTGTPYLFRLQGGLRTPKRNTTGSDVAGRVEAVGRNVTQYQPGDEVFGNGSGTLAEYVTVSEDTVVPKPAALTFVQAGAVGVAALTALQGLRDHGDLQSGQKVLINGAAGGVGTYAVQIAKALGAEVTGVCSTRNVDLVRSLGADHVVDYTQEDFAEDERRYDLLLDNVGNRSLTACRSTLKPDGTYVIVSGPKKNRLLGPVMRMARALVFFRFVSQDAIWFVAKINKADLVTLKELLESGKVVPVVDRQYELSEAAEAFRYLGQGHARGKVVVTI